MARDDGEIDSGTYRRGLTLGLTMAEIFMLLLFLLLLIFSALYKEFEQTKDTLQDTQEDLMEIATKYEERAIFPKEIQRIKRKNKELEKTITEIEEENTITKSFLEELENDLIASKEENIDSAAQLERMRKQNIKLRNQLYASKGVDPPCWYEVILRKGERHEKPHYLLDVAVHDEYLRVRVNESVPLPGHAVDENNQRASTSYTEEYEKLPLGHLAAVKEKQVSLEEFKELAGPIKHMGKDGQMRDYACVFYVRIWDHTSATAKKRWKQARDRIEDFFYPLLVRNDSWE